MNINELPWLDKIFNKINFNNLSHGIILNGPEGIGKSILAKEISKKLIVKEDDFKSTNLFNLNTHPDFFLLNKDKILTKHISLRDKEWDDELGNRNVIDFLSITPSISHNKVALLMNAHTMNEVSQNALLKSLEDSSYFISIFLLFFSRFFVFLLLIYNQYIYSYLRIIFKAFTIIITFLNSSIAL